MYQIDTAEYIAAIDYVAANNKAFKGDKQDIQEKLNSLIKSLIADDKVDSIRSAGFKVEKYIDEQQIEIFVCPRFDIYGPLVGVNVILDG